MPINSYIALLVTARQGNSLAEREDPRRVLWVRSGQPPQHPHHHLHYGKLGPYTGARGKTAAAPAGLGRPENTPEQVAPTCDFCSPRKPSTSASRWFALETDLNYVKETSGCWSALRMACHVLDLDLRVSEAPDM